MNRFTAIILCLTGAVAAKPLPPYSLSLDKHSILTIPIHTEIDTLLIFPSEIESIVGNGLTTGGEFSGSVLYQQGDENPKIIVLKHLDSTSKVLMTVMWDDTAFVFKLTPDTSPASVIYFQKSDVKTPKKQRSLKLLSSKAKMPFSFLEQFAITVQNLFISGTIKVYSKSVIAVFIRLISSELANNSFSPMKQQLSKGC